MTFAEWTKKRKEEEQAKQATQQKPTQEGTRETASSSGAGKTTSFAEWTRQRGGTGGTNYDITRSSSSSTEKRSYYSADDMNKNREYLYRDITDIESSYLEKRKQMEAATSELERLSAQFNANRNNEQVYNSYKAAYDNYNKLWKEFEPIQTNYTNAVNAYNDEYTNWRSTIRDSSEIEKALAALDEQAKIVKRDLNAYTTAAGYARKSEDAETLTAKVSELTAQLDEIEKQRALLVEEREYGEHFSYTDLMEGADFEEYSAKGAALKNPEKLSAKPGEQVQNVVTYFREDNPNDYYDKYSYMNEDEVAIYNYLLAKEGKEKAAEYLDHLEEYLNARKGKEMGESVRDIDNGLGRTLATGAYGLQAGLDQFTGGVAQFFSKEDLPTSAIQYGSQYIQDDLADTKVAKHLYNATTTIGNMAPSILLSTVTGGLAGAAGASAAVAGAIGSGLGSASMGLSASGNAYGMALEQGYNPSQARTYSYFVGASEAVLQYALGGIGKLGGVADDVLLAKVAAIDNAFARVALTGAVKIGSEITEEELQNFIEPMLASIIFNENYDAPTIEELVETAIVTALSTGALEGGSIVTAGSNKMKGMDADTAKAIIEEGLATDPNSQSYKLAEALQKQMDGGKTVNDFQINALYGQNVDNVDMTADPDAILAEAAREAVARETGVEATELAQERTLSEEGETPTQTASEASTSARAAMSAAAEASIPYQVLNVGNVDKLAGAAMHNQAVKDVLKNANYGKNGTVAFASAVRNSIENPSTVMKRFDAAYQVGLTGVPMREANLTTDFQRMAYNAGRMDYIMQKKVDKKHTPSVIFTEEASGFDSTNAPKDVTQAERDFANWFAKSMGVQGGFNTEEDLPYNAFYDPKTGSVDFAQDFGIGPKLMQKLGSMDFQQKVEKLAEQRSHSFVFYVGHEIAGHVTMDRAPKQMRAFVNAMYNYKQGKSKENLARDKQTIYGIGKVKLDTSAAVEEVTSDSIMDLYETEQDFMDAMHRVFNGVNEDAKAGARKYLEILKDTITKLKAWVGRMTGNTSAVEQGINELEHLRDMFEKAVAASMKQVMKARGSDKAVTKRDGKLFRTTEEDGTDVLTTANGNPVAMMDENGGAVFSLKTYDAFGRAELKRWLDLRVKKNQIDKADAADIVRQLDEYFNLCQQFLNKYAPFGAWSNAEVVRDNQGKPVFSVVKANGDYAMNLDFSLVRKKRRTLDAVFGEMIKRGMMDNVDLAEADIAKINDVIRESGFETACALCFVDAKRYRQAKVADAFVNQYNELVMKLLPEGGDVKAHYFDFVETGHYKNKGTGLHTMSNAELKSGIDKLKQVMRENGSKTVPYKIAKHLLENPQDRKLVNRGEFMNTDGFGAVRLKNPRVLSLYNSSKGSGGPKAAFADVQYLGEILKKNNFTPGRAYAVGGVRIQSFSDYIPRLVFDYMQMVADLSAKKLPAHAYTKEAIFVQQFGMTGIKMNMSLVPAVAEDGVAAGLDKDGNYLWFDGQSFGSTVGVKGSAQSGFELAIEIQNAEGYSQHCGTIAVGVSDEHIWKMLDDENIRMIIPYHKSSLNHIVAVMNNIDKYTDYTTVQNTRFKDTGKKIEKKDDFNYNEALRRTGDAKAAANEYLAWCEKKGYIPKFDTFAGHENYYKVLEDFSTYDNGVAAPQGPVTMTFPKKGDVFGSMAELIEQGLDEDAVLEGRRDKNLSSIVDKVEGVLNKREDGKKYSMKEYTPIREKLAKAELDRVSDKLGEQFPLSARFDAYIKGTEDVVSSPTVSAGAVSRNGKSYFKAAKDEFIKCYKKDETVNMAGTGIIAKLRTDVASESVSKSMKLGDEQVILDVIPHAKGLIEGGKIFGIERLQHTDNKSAGLFAYRVYNAFEYESVDPQTKKATTTPYVFVATVVQQYDGDSVVHVVRGIEIATYDRGKLGKTEESSPITGGKYKVSHLYKFVKGISRDDGGLKYTPQEAHDYLFRYTQKEDGTKYSLKDLERVGLTTGNAVQDNEEYSLKDSEGTTLTKAQQDFFHDSKARDKDGNLQVFYHGTTSGGFTTFDPEHSDDRTSLFFTTSLSNAASYSGTHDIHVPGSKEKATNYAVYLNLTEPLILYAENANFDEIKFYTAEMKAMSDRSTELTNYGYSLDENDPKRAEAFAESDDLLDALDEMDLWNGDRKDTRFIAKWAKDHGYNGVIIHDLVDYAGAIDVPIESATVAIAFSSEQVNSISNKNPTPDPDTRYSMKDSEGRDLSEGQIEYFQNSKVRDKDGNLLVMYHGTSNSGFTVFDTYASNFGLFGQGSYFTDNRSVAESYQAKGKGTAPGVYSVYLNVERPLDMDGDADIEKWKKAFRSYDLDESYLDGVTSNEDAFKALKENLADEMYTRSEAIETVTDLILSMKYDGITHIGGGRFNKKDDTRHRVFIVFESEQVKDINNLNPTDSYDINYSLKGEEEMREEIKRIRTDGRKAGKSETDIDQEIMDVVGKQYGELIKVYGEIQRGERSARDIKVPSRTGKNRHVSKTIRTILEAGATPDAAVPTIQELITQGEFSFERITDEGALAEAEDKIKYKGFETALADWMSDVKKGNVSKANTAMGWSLYNAAASNGDLKTAMTILNGMVQHQRSAAQALQATRILKTMSADAQLFGIQRSVESLKDELVEKYGDKAPDLQINEELARKFLEAATDEERAAAERELYKDIGSQIPSRFVDKWNAWRYLAMLGNPRTHVRNILGNAGFAPVVAVKNVVATGIERLVLRNAADRTKAIALATKEGRALIRAAWDDYANVADEITAGGKYNDAANKNQHIEEGRVIFGRVEQAKTGVGRVVSKTAGKAVEAARKGNTAAMEKEDMWFARPHYAFALAQYCKAHGVSVENLRKGKALGNGRAYAIKEAQKATYRDTNVFSQAISELGRYNGKNPAKKAISLVAEGILPFRKTPANILVRGIEYSPVGLLKSLTIDLIKVKNGTITAAEAIDNISAGLTGTGLLALGAWLAAEGLIRGAGGDDEEEKKFEELQGHQAYSLELPNGTSVTLDWLAPEVLPMFIGVNLYEMASEKKEGSSLSDILTAVSNVTEPLLEMSCLQGLNDVFDSVGYAKDGGLDALPSALISATTSYLTQAFPTLLGQAERSSQGERMTTYTEKDNFLTSDLQYTLGKISAKIPGWDFQQIPYVDAWGRTESTGTKAENAANNFLNPAYMSQIETSEMETELQRLYDATGEKKLFPSRPDKYITVDGDKKYLTGEEYVKYATEQGQLSYDVLTDLTSRPEYDDMSDVEKAEAVGYALDYAKAIAKTKVSDYEPDGWIASAVESGMDEVDYLLYKMALSMYDTPNKNGELGGTPTNIEKANAILSRGNLTNGEITALWDTEKGYEAYAAGVDMRAYVEHVSNGGEVTLNKLIEVQGKNISATTYFTFRDMVKKYDEPNKNGNLGTYTNDEVEAAIDATPGLTRSQRHYLWVSMGKNEKTSPYR